MGSSATDSQRNDKLIRENLVRTGHVDVIISVANNFFYTKSLPCSLWFFDKGKPDELKNKVLFIDARNYYTVVDRTLNEWSEWQLKNLNSIVWLHRGETDKYLKLLDEYHAALGNDRPFVDNVRELAAKGDALKEEAKAAVEAADKREKKKVRAEYDDRIAELGVLLNTAVEADWLYSRFGEGEYTDVEGLCKSADLCEIEANGFSLTPGAYVGVEAADDDDVDFAARMREIHSELLSLQAESNDLMEAISKNMEEMGL